VSHVPQNGRVYRISNDGVEEVAQIQTGILALEASQLRPMTAAEVARPEVQFFALKKSQKTHSSETDC
jgi:hypothetical protein